MVVVPFLQKYTQKEQAKREQARLEQSQFEGEGEVVLFLEVGVDDGEVVEEDGHQVGTVEVLVAVSRDILLDKRHTVEVAQEVGTPDLGWINTLVAEFAEKASVAAVDGIGDTSEVAEVVVSRTSVDVVDGHACGYLLIAPGDIYGMGRKDMFTLTESILELQIVVIAMAIFVPIILACGIFQYFSTVGIDAHAYYATLAVVGVEGDVCLGAGSDIGNLHVVKEER